MALPLPPLDPADVTPLVRQLLDIIHQQQQRIDQHSIRFERFNGATVLAITGNYYGAYSAVKSPDELRARQTFVW